MADNIDVSSIKTVSGNFPAWLKRATSKGSPNTKQNETVRTMSFGIDGGKEIIVPSIRLVDGKLKRYKAQDAFQEAMRRKDYVVTNSRTEATKMSKAISEYIYSKRKSILSGSK